MRKAEVEARLLAGQGNDVIAERCGIPAESVRAYHDLFFDIRPYLNNAAVVARLALSWTPEKGEIDYPGALKLFGYSLGGRAVDALLHYAVALPGHGGSEDVTVSEAAHRVSWNLLLKLVARTLNSRGWSERTDELLSLVALLREDGSSLVAEGVEIPVPRPWRLEPVEFTRLYTWQESAAQLWSELELDKEPLLSDDEEDEDRKMAGAACGGYWTG